MDYRYSEVIDTGSYQDDGLAHDIPLRMHRDPYSEISGTLQAQKDWNREVAPLGEYFGNLGPVYSFIRVTVPECRPERLEIMSYANEFAFLYDDEMEKLELKNIQSDGAEMLDVFKKDALELKVEADARPEKKLQARIFKKMMALDSKRAVTSMKAWATFVQLASRTRTRPFGTLAEYLPSRIIDAGELIWYGTLTFAMALTIPEGELDVCFSIARPGYAAISLTNDLYSWKKERKAAEDDGLDYVFNAIWVIMQERSVTEEEAIDICKEEISKYIADFNDALNNIDALGLHKDTTTYLEAVRCSYIGNLVWSIYCPRYQEF